MANRNDHLMLNSGLFHAPPMRKRRTTPPAPQPKPEPAQPATTAPLTPLRWLRQLFRRTP